MIRKTIFHFTASGCYTSLCLASLSLSTDIILLHSKLDFIYFSFLFFASFLYYNFQKISWFGHPRMLQTNNLKYQWTAQNPGMLLLCLIIGFTGSVALISLAVINFYQLILGIVAIILCFCYNQKIFGIHLRSKRGLKAFTIALVIIISGVLIPSAKYYWQEIQVQLFLIYVVAQFCFVAAFCIAADIRDIKEDKEDHIDTFPVIAGIEISKTISILLLVIQLSLLVILYSLSFFNLAQFEGFIFISLLSLHFIKQLHTKNSYYYFIIGIDGLIAAQAMSLIIFSI